MKKIVAVVSIALWLSLFLLNACKKDDTDKGPTPYNLVIPQGLPAMPIPADNPLTVEGVALGRKLFYDPILSGNNTQACAGCHRQNFAFVDSSLQHSIGIDNLPGTRNAMPIFNLGWNNKGFFWDGGASNLESQVIGPIQNPVEMHETLPNAISELRAHNEYPALFKAAFGSDSITVPLLMKAIAQFERTLISGNSKYDQFLRGTATLTPQELNGLDLYTNMSKGDCNHCHVLGSTFTDFEYRNTGLDSIPVDKGRALITLATTDEGKFKTPTLRNIALTAPYMHDGRFSNLTEVLNFYNTGYHYTQNLDLNLQTAVKGRLSNQEMLDIIAFLNTLTDTEFTTNPNFSKP
jgi:cytochrome c peroxidase